ncbi:MAG TPA: winged helix-turn-helix domain-containing protein [Acidobacteriaceae bacterium]
MTAGTLTFGEFELDCDRFQLRRGALPLRLERKPLELLILLATSGGRLVTREEIARLLWPSEVFVDTEHGINTAIRKIRHALRDDPDHPRFLQTVTGKGYRFSGVTTTSQPSVETSSFEAGTHTLPSQSHRVAWLTAFVAVVLVAVTAAAIFGARSVHGHTAKPVITSVAVLPLDNLSGDSTQDYLADGMTDELTTMLAKSSTLRVISRTSVMQFKGAHRPLPEIARQLNVDGILEGSLARTGDNLHMTVQLIHAPTDTHLWAESYDRSPNDLVTLPHDAALTIAKVTHTATDPALASIAQPKYISPAAHDAYLRGHYLWYAGNDQASGPYFLKATQLQPDYALAWAGLSSYYGAGSVDNYLDPRQAIPLSVAAARKSIELDPTLPEARVVAAAAIDWINDWNLNAALDDLHRAIQLDPANSEAWHLRSKMLIQLNRPQEGIEEQRKAMEITPFERPWGMAYVYLQTRHFDDSIADATQRIEGAPNPILWWVLSQAYGGKGMEKESEQALEQALLLWNQTTASESIHRAFARGGRSAVLRWRIDDLKAQASKRYVSPYLLASYYGQLGDKQQALFYLDESLRQHAPAILDVQNDTSFDSLHTDPHYRAIVQKIGLPPAW